MTLEWRPGPLIQSPGKSSLMRYLTRQSSNITKQATKAPPVLQTVGTPSTKARDGKMLGVFREEQGGPSARIIVSEGQSTGNEVRDEEGGSSYTEPCQP